MHECFCGPAIRSFRGEDCCSEGVGDLDRSVLMGKREVKSWYAETMDKETFGRGEKGGKG